METNLTRCSKLVEGGYLPVSSLQILADKHDPIVSVGRTAFPFWIRKIMHKKFCFEENSRDNFDVERVEQWLHPKQKKGVIRGEFLYEFFKDNNLLDGCLSFSDLCAIQAKGLPFFHRYFNKKMGFGWKSVIQSRNGILFAPFIFEFSGRIFVLWRCLNKKWGSLSPALRLLD